MSQRNLKPTRYLSFAWGTGNDFLLWNRASKKPITVSIPGGVDNKKILKGALLINWEECDEIENKVIRAFAHNLYHFHLQKLEIMNNEDDEQDQQSKQAILFQKVRETNFSYCNDLRKATESYQQMNNNEEALEYAQYSLIWKLADIFYMRENNSSKTQEYSHWLRHFPDIAAAKKDIEERGQCDWDSLFFYLALGDIDNVIAILEGLKTGGNGEVAVGFALHETIEVLRKKIKYFKGDDCPFMDKPSFKEQLNKERDRFTNLHKKWEAIPGLDKDFIKFLRVVTGDLHAIEDVSRGDWRLYLNLIFLFYYPFVEKAALEPIMNEFTMKYPIYDSDRIFLSIILNPRAFIFIQSILRELPAWFTFHLSDMLYLFKQVPLEPITINEYDVDPGMTFFDMALHELLGYMVESRAPYDVLKYYVFYLFQIYAQDKECRLSDEYLVFIQQIYEQRMDSTAPEDIQDYLHELNDQIFVDVEEVSNGLFLTLRSNLMKRLARNYTSSVILTEKNIKSALEVMENLKDAIFIDEYASILAKEYEEKGNQAVATVLTNFENEGSAIFQESEVLSFLVKYCKFKRLIQNEKNDYYRLQEAKELLVDMILRQNSPLNRRLLVLNYAIELFENSHVKFTTEQIHGFTEQLAAVESALRFEVNSDQKNLKKIVQAVKLCLMKCLSRSIISE